VPSSERSHQNQDTAAFFIEPNVESKFHRPTSKRNVWHSNRACTRPLYSSVPPGFEAHEHWWADNPLAPLAQDRPQGFRKIGPVEIPLRYSAGIRGINAGHPAHVGRPKIALLNFWPSRWRIRGWRILIGADAGHQFRRSGW